MCFIFYFLLIKFLSINGLRSGAFNEEAFDTWKEVPNCAIVSAGKYELPMSNTCVLYECNSKRTNPCNKRYENARDGQAYVSYILNNYDFLPNFIIFVHGHAQSWHQHKHINLNREKFVGYEGLNGQPIKMDNFAQSEYGVIWKNLFPQYPVPQKICSDGSMQFIVSKERLHIYSKADWSKLYAFLYVLNVSLEIMPWDPADKEISSEKFQKTSYFIEWIIHIFLGEPHCK